MKQIVKYYGKWIQSKPFDIGGTIRNAFFKCDIKNPRPERVIEAAKKKDSESNGSLMRISPLAVWLYKIESEEQLRNAVKLEVSLSHSNQTV